MLVLVRQWPPEMVPAAEADSGFCEHRLAKCLDVVEAGTLQQAGDAWKEVEARLREVRRDAADVVEQLRQPVAPRAQPGDEWRCRLPRQRQRGDSRVLDEVRGTGLGVDVEPIDFVDQPTGSNGAAKPPAGHRELLRKRVENQRPLAHPRQARNRARLAAKEHVEVRIIADHQQVMLDGKLRQPLHLRHRRRGARRIVVVIVEQMARAGGDAGLDGVEVEPKSVVGIDVAVGVRDAAVELDLRFVDGIAGVGVQDGIAALHHRGDILADGGFAARLDRDVGCAIV